MVITSLPEGLNRAQFAHASPHSRHDYQLQYKHHLHHTTRTHCPRSLQARIVRCWWIALRLMLSWQPKTCGCGRWGITASQGPRWARGCNPYNGKCKWGVLAQIGAAWGGTTGLHGPGTRSKPPILRVLNPFLNLVWSKSEVTGRF